MTVNIRMEQFIAAVRQAANDGISAAALQARDIAVRKAGRPGGSLKGSPPGTPPFARRSGGLYTRMAATKSVNLKASFGSSVPYARIHELGGTIRPKRSKYLAIPVTRTAARMSSPRQDPTLVAIRTKRGGLQLVKRMGGSGRHGRIETQFRLVKSVRLPARPYLRPAVFNNRGKIMAAVNLAASKSLQRFAVASIVTTRRL